MYPISSALGQFSLHWTYSVLPDWRGLCVSPGAGVIVVGDTVESRGGGGGASGEAKKHTGLRLLCSRPPLFPALAVLRLCQAPVSPTSAV